MDYTLEQFKTEFEALCKKADDAGIPVEEFVDIAETVLERGSWIVSLPE